MPRPADRRDAIADAESSPPRSLVIMTANVGRSLGNMRRSVGMIGRSRLPDSGFACVARQRVTGLATSNSTSPMRRRRRPSAALPTRREPSTATFERKAPLGDPGRFGNRARQRGETAAPVQRRVARLPVLVAGRDAVADDAQGERRGACADGALVETAEVDLDHRGEAQTPGIVHDVVEQDIVAQADAQAQRPVVERNLERRQTRACGRAPPCPASFPTRSPATRASLNRRPSTRSPGDAPAGQDIEDIACLAGESLHGIAEQRGDAHAGRSRPLSACRARKRLKAAAARISAFSAFASIASPSWMSMPGACCRRGSR
jgi:hypothetical protein